MIKDIINAIKSIWEENNTFVGAAIATLITLAFIFGFWCLTAWLIMLLWNWAVVGIFNNAPTFTFWHTLGMFLLFNLLFNNVFSVKVKKE